MADHVEVEEDNVVSGVDVDGALVLIVGVDIKVGVGGCSAGVTEDRVGDSVVTIVGLVKLVTCV